MSNKKKNNIKQKPGSDDYDSPWKEIIEQYFPEFIEFFFPKVYKDIDWKRKYEFLDKRVAAIVTSGVKVYQNQRLKVYHFFPYPQGGCVFFLFSFPYICDIIF